MELRLPRESPEDKGLVRLQSKPLGHEQGAAPPTHLCHRPLLTDAQGR